MPFILAQNEFRGPPSGWGAAETINNRCLVLRVAWEGFSVLCAGDIERPAEQLVAREDCRARFLKEK